MKIQNIPIYHPNNSLRYLLSLLAPSVCVCVCVYVCVSVCLCVCVSPSALFPKTCCSHIYSYRNISVPGYHSNLFLAVQSILEQLCIRGMKELQYAWSKRGGRM